MIYICPSYCLRTYIGCCCVLGIGVYVDGVYENQRIGLLTTTVYLSSEL